MWLSLFIHNSFFRKTHQINLKHIFLLVIFLFAIKFHRNGTNIVRGIVYRMNYFCSCFSGRMSHHAEDASAVVYVNFKNYISLCRLHNTLQSSSLIRNSLLALTKSFIVIFCERIRWKKVEDILSYLWRRAVATLKAWVFRYQ